MFGRTESSPRPYRLLGIDEAGRGCVIGPMVIAGVLINRCNLPRLEAIGVKDSKVLSRQKRPALADAIRTLAPETKVLFVTPAEIDAGNLNRIEVEKIVELIQVLTPDEAVIDVPTHPGGIAGFCQMIRSRLPSSPVRIIGTNRAEAQFSVVAAASILAKVERDQALEPLRARYGDFGWGYPSETKTTTFLQRWLDQEGVLPSCVRTRWATIERLRQNTLFPDR